MKWKPQHYRKMARKYLKENKHDIDGYVVYIGNIEHISNKLQIRRIVIQVEASGYDQEVQFDCINENMRLMQGLALGEHIHITFALRGKGVIGKDAKKKWYGNNEVLNISKI